MSPPNPSKRILVLGTHGQFNIGDELLLETFLHQLGSQHQYAVNSYAPAETTAQLTGRFDVTVFDTRGERIALARHLWSSDVIVFAGGSILKELYGSVGRWRYATLCMVLAVVAFGRIVARRPMLMSNIGVGPLPTRAGRHLTGLILKMVNLVSVRDRRSLETCTAVGVDPSKVRLVPDAAWVNDAATFSGHGRRESGARPKEPGRRIRIALNLNRDIENGPIWSAFVARLTAALNLVACEVPIELHALPMQSRFKDHHDLEVIEDLFGRLPDVPTVRHDPRDHREVGEIIASADLVVCERLHGLVIAAVLGTASVALIYDVKVAELVDQLGLDERSVDINLPLDPEKLAKTIITAIDDAPAEGPRLAARAAELRGQATAYFGDVRRWLARTDDSAWPAS